MRARERGHEGRLAELAVSTVAQKYLQTVSGRNFSKTPFANLLSSF
jgi:hypothetical protein